MGAFPVKAAMAAQPAVEAKEGSAAQPARDAVAAFTTHQQRSWVSRVRTAYRLALGMEKEAEEDKASAKREQYEADMERPIDGETRLRIKSQWCGRHG